MSFLNTEAILFGAALVSAMPGILSAQDIEESARMKSLQGHVGVIVGVSNVPEELEEMGLRRSALKTSIELRLRSLGINVLPEDSETLAPLMELHLITLPILGGDGVAYTVQARLKQLAFPQAAQDNPDRVCLGEQGDTCVSPAVFTVTWESPGFIGVTTRDDLDRLRQAVEEEVNEFANAWLSVRTN